MALTFTAASSSNLSRTNPTGILTNAAWTFGCWVNTNSYATDGRMILRVGNVGFTDGVEFGFNGSGILRVLQPGSTATLSGTTPIGTSTWVRVGATRLASGVAHIKTILNGAVDGDDNNDPPVEISSGAVLQISDNDGGRGFVYLDGGVVAAFWLQGVSLTAAQIDDYLNSTNGKTPCSLITDYGVSGGITANALKGLWLMADSGSAGADISGVSNTLTATSVSTLANPSGVPTTCTASAVNSNFFAFFKTA